MKPSSPCASQHSRDKKIFGDKKMVGEHQIDVTLATGCTLYVTGYEITVDEKWIRNIFGRYETFVTVRIPSLTLKQIAVRRFCYVQCASADQAKAAVRNLDSVMFGRAQLVVKVSDPVVKKARRSSQQSSSERATEPLGPADVNHRRR